MLMLLVRGGACCGEPKVMPAVDGCPIVSRLDVIISALRLACLLFSLAAP